MIGMKDLGLNADIVEGWSVRRHRWNVRSASSLGTLTVGSIHTMFHQQY